MRYAVRQSPDINADLQRGWSAWRGLRGSTLQELVDMTPDFSESEVEEAWQDSPEQDYEKFLLGYIECKPGNWEPVYDPTTGYWYWLHHYGLSVYGLAAETEDEALAEAKALVARLGESSGQGDMMRGSVTVIAELGNDWYLLACDGYSPEL